MNIGLLSSAKAQSSSPREWLLLPESLCSLVVSCQKGMFIVAPPKSSSAVLLQGASIISASLEVFPPHYEA